MQEEVSRIGFVICRIGKWITTMLQKPEIFKKYCLNSNIIGCTETFSTFHFCFVIIHIYRWSADHQASFIEYQLM